ncbi:MAG: MBL fold metallo-hydrolase [Deltaproteobacteria bacterium]|nr:MBL fold metallo-hydrolase [Deltaproteobacteria bacterium]
MGFYVKFWGTRGSIPTPGYLTQVYGGNTACVEIRIDDVLFICDGGSGLRELGLNLLKRGKSPITGHLFLSHAHWDHIQGFPFFLPVYNPANTFWVYGSSSGDTRLYRLLSGQMQSDYFPVKFSDLGAKILSDDLGEGEKVIEGVKVRCTEQIHHGPSYGYSFEKDDRKVVYATDHEVDQVIVNKEEVERDPSVMRKIPDDYLDFLRGADLLIADGQYTDEEYPKRIGFGHARANTLVDMAIQAEARQLAITHHEPLHSDDMVKQKIVDCRKRAEDFGASELVIFGAREGMELRIDAPKGR